MIALIATLLSLWLSRRISRPLEEMKRGAERFARGELDGRLPSYSGEEMGGLAEAMNQMAAQLDDRIRTVVRQRNEQEAVLSSMIEGVIAVDKEERILRINQTAAHLLDLDARRSGWPTHTGEDPQARAAKIHSGSAAEPVSYRSGSLPAYPRVETLPAGARDALA